MNVPTDYTLAQSTKVTTEFTFELTVVAGCDVTQFVDWFHDTAEPIKANVLAEPVTVALGPVQDTVSRQEGNKDGLTFCGER